MKTKPNYTLNNLPQDILDEAKEMLRGEDTVVNVIRWNRKIRVVGHVFPYEHSMDEELLLTIHETDVFTDEERAENYINYYLKYPSWYKGLRDETMLQRMKEEMEYDAETQTMFMPYGRIVNGNFVYNGDRKEYCNK